MADQETKEGECWPILKNILFNPFPRLEKVKKLSEFAGTGFPYYTIFLYYADDQKRIPNINSAEIVLLGDQQCDPGRS